MILVDAEVLGQPIPKARPRLSKFGRVYTPQRTKDYENLISEALPSININQPVHVEIIAIFKRPQRLKRNKDPKGLVPHDKRPDLDNVVKAILDSLKDILHDDSLVTSILAKKFYAEIEQQPRTLIKIYSL